VYCHSCANFYTNLGGRNTAAHCGAHARRDQTVSLNRWWPQYEPDLVTNFSQRFNLHVPIAWSDDTNHTKNSALANVSIALKAI
jgi:hypothetical protein